MKTAVFRADASPDIGGGHIARCMVLAEELAADGWACVFTCRTGSADAVPTLRGSGYRMSAIDPADTGSPDAARAASPGGCDLMVVDHYGLAAAFESACRPWAKRILVVDDLADRTHDCDVLLDQTYGRPASDYDGLVPEGCERLVGGDYALVRRAIRDRRGESLRRRTAAASAKRILVGFGATDPFRIAVRAVKAIASLPGAYDVDVILGDPAAIADCDAACGASASTFRFHAYVADMERLLADADLAVGAAGTSSWERCCLGVPTVVITIAENQALIAANLGAAGAAAVLGTHDSVGDDNIARAVAGLLDDSAARTAMSKRAAAICDGDGVVRALERILH